MDFIFLLTRGDKTVEDCLDVFEEIAPLSLGHVGFKDVGVPPETLRHLVGAIRKTGATTYMEVVSTTPESALNSARVGREPGVDCLLGGTQVAATLRILEALTGSRLIDHSPASTTMLYGHAVRFGVLSQSMNHRQNNYLA